MKLFSKTKYMLPAVVAALSLNSCVETVEPADGTATSGQISGNSESFSMLVKGLKSMMITVGSYGTESGSYEEATADWGYPNYMFIKDIMLDGMPSTGTAWNYEYAYEAATSLAGYSPYPYYYYYKFINNTNRILKSAKEDGASTEMKQMLAITRTYRALCYMDLAMMYEYYQTGIPSLDEKAQNTGIMGLTVPISSEYTTAEQGKNNPRAPFYTMYRFILNDLTLAEQNIGQYDRSGTNDIDGTVISGLLARFWLNLGTRFSRHPEDLATQLEHESDADGWQPLRIQSANDCYKLASEYADKVIAAGYTPMTESEWHDVKTGFNTANRSWVWGYSFTSEEQIPRYWCTFMGNVASENTWGLPAYGGEYRCISKKLYNRMSDSDWRKLSWVAPEDAGAEKVPAKYYTQLKDETPSSLESNLNWSRLPAYANLKFRVADGGLENEKKGLLVDFPLMRVEEMYFIKTEATLHLNGLAAAKSELAQFMNANRYTDGSYSCQAANEEEFIDEMIAQKHIEFWGEGVLFNDYKRLGLQVDRKGDTNYLDGYQLTSIKGYAAPWMNFYISNVEMDFNKGVIANPDPTSEIAEYCK